MRPLTLDPPASFSRASFAQRSLAAIAQDLRYSLRSLRRSPGFTLTAVTTLAVAIGANAAVFTVTNAVLFKGFPLVHESDRLVYLASRGAGYGPFVSYPDFEDWRAQAQSFDGMGAVNAVRLTLSDESGGSVTCDGTEVSANAFQLLGQQPILGRDFAPADEKPGANPVAILSHDFWERRYGRDPAVIGRTVRLNGIGTTVIGVMPRGFTFPRRQDLWLPLVPTAKLDARDARGLWFVFGRLANGGTIETARAEMTSIGHQLAAAYPRTNQGLVPIVQSFHEFFIGPRATTMYAAMVGAAALVLAIACANLANLLLGRTLSRSREMSVRLALGAGRWRIVRQLFVESLAISAAAGLLGWLIARWSVRVYELTAGPPGWFDRALDYTMDARVVAYLVAVSTGTGILFALAPALGLWRRDIDASLKADGRSTSEGRQRRLPSATLVGGEMALAAVLLAGAGVMAHSFVNAATANLGVDATHTLATFLELPETRYPDADTQRAFYDRLEARLQVIPGVESIAIADRAPAQGARRIPFEVAGTPPVDAARRPLLAALIVGPSYFQTLGAPVHAGRAFDAHDGPSAAPVAIVNERFAREHWPEQDPIGKRLRLYNDTEAGVWRTVVGVAPNIVQTDITRQEIQPLVYLPYRQTPARGMWVFARTRVPPGNLAMAVRGEVRALDPDLATFEALPLSAHLAEGYRSTRLLGALSLVAAAIALLLAATGLYAVVAAAVGRRTREIGIRSAMGATRRDIFTLVFRNGMLPVIIGLIAGLAAALMLMPLLESQLVRVSPADPVTFVLASAALIASGALGCLIPARRALRVDPVVALRHE